MGKTGKTSFPWSLYIGPKPGNSKPISITLDKTKNRTRTTTKEVFFSIENEHDNYDEGMVSLSIGTNLKYDESKLTK